MTALDGLRIVEYSSLVAGPFCAKLLADMGAEVIKIEPPGQGDEARTKGPFPKDFPHPERSGLFLYVNTNKMGITLDPENPAGYRIFLALAREADVFVHDSPPLEAQTLRIDYETLKAVNPRLIVTSVTPFGSTGPYAEYSARELNIAHAGSEGYVLPGGLAYSMAPDRPPVKLGGHATDYDAGMTAAVATMYAVMAREITGRGQHVDVSRQEAEIALNRVLFSTYHAEGKVVRRENRHYPFGGLFCAKDGEVVLRPAEDNHWRALARAMGRPELADDPLYRDRAGRLKNGKSLNAAIARWASSRTKQEINNACHEQGCPVGPCASVAEIMDAPQVKHRRFFQTIDHPEAGALLYPTASYQFSETPWSARRPAPMLGQHNGEILNGRLGYSPAELELLRSQRVI